MLSKKAKLILKLLSKSAAKNFTIRELDSLMMHPVNKLYGYHVKMVIKYLKEVGEIE